MIKKQSLVVLVVLFAGFVGFGQIAAWDFTGENTVATSAAEVYNANLDASNLLTRGAGAAASAGANSFRTVGFQNNGIATTSTDYFQFTLSASTGFTLSLSTIDARFNGTATFANSPGVTHQFAYSFDETNFTLIGNPQITVGNTTPLSQIDLTGISTLQNIDAGTTVTIRYYASGQTTTGGWGFYSSAGGVYGLSVGGYVSSTDEVDWCNLQSPTSGSMTVAGTYNVYAQVHESGITEPGGQGAGINAWIGYSTSNTDPSTWTDWVAASFNVDIGNYDEYIADIGSVISASGTYYYASRFQLNGGLYKYGGYNVGGGGFWDGSTNVSGILTVDQVDFGNLQSPNMATIDLCDTFEVYGQVYEFGVTDTPNDQGSGIVAEVGYSTTNTNPNTWTNWIPTTYNPTCTGGNNCNFDQNDEYYGNLGAAITTPGTYYYAMRYALNSGAYSYGGILADGSAGNFWDGVTYISGVLTVTDPPLANVVITEIMYNTPTAGGDDDDWIEVCNISGSTQDISNYIIEVAGAPKFTFPCGTTIADGACITIDLGDGGGAEYNFDCPFVADYSSGLSTGTLPNSNDRVIALKASNGTEADSVTYNNGDGGNGNGSSLHVIDASLDNSSTSSNWQEVDYGGSSGANTLFPNCIPAGVEINVEGNLGNFPDITNGDNTPSGTDNTLFAAQFVGASQAKSYRIQSLLADDVEISSVTITGDFGDFIVTVNPNSPISYGTPSILEITFSPTVPGTRTAIVHIFNNDADEPEYTFTIRGNGLCATSSNTITPSLGPVGTIVTVTGTNLSTATASFNGISATVTHISDSEMEVIVPSGAVTGNLEIIDSQPCTSTIPFTVIDNQISSCEGGSALTEIFISEVTDATYGGLTYIELYNPTSGDIDLSNYSIDIYINGNTDSSNTSLYKTQALSGTISANQTFVISAGYSGSANCDSQPGGDTSYGSFDSTTLGGINKKDNEHDYIGLLNSGVLIDEFGVFGDNVWMDTLHTTVTGDRGFDFRRLNTASPFTSPFDDNDWLIIDWAGSGSGSCSTNDYSDIRFYDFSTGTPPSVSSGPTIVFSCNTATISVTGTEGSDPAGLTYQWYYSAPGDSDWTAVPDDGTYNDVNTATLYILDTSLLEGYQYYCQILEDDASCYTASEAVQLTLPTTTWNGSSWSSPPDINTAAIVNGNYNTSTNSSFSACSLIVNNGFTLNIADGNYVEVENNLTVNGHIIMQPQGSFVQNNDLGSVDGAVLSDKTKIVVNKKTAPMNYWYEYTYWSSPVFGEIINDGLADATPNRRFWFNAQNYLDQCAETDNDNTCVLGQDGIDDGAPYDWTLAAGSDVMLPGVGYASTHRSDLFFGPPPGTPPFQFDYTFEGPFNNGVITVPIYRNDLEMNDTNSNFIGNPYPSAIDVDDFFALNVYDVDSNPDGVLEGVIYLWSQNTPPSSTANGNQNLNFSDLDYAIINGSGETAGGDGLIPNRFIPSGQGFFVDYSNSGATVAINGDIKTGEVIFNNGMRVTGDNDQFFRVSNSKSPKSKGDSNKLWVNLTSDVGVFSQILVGYINGATNGFDGLYYDAPRNLSAKTASALYSILDDLSKFAIQGKDPNSLNLGEVIPLGFYTAITGATLYKLSVAQFEGDFLSSNTIYLKDNLLHKVHDLTTSDYSFTSEVGEFNNRFEIMFRSEALSDTDAQLNSNKLTIIELNDGGVQMKTNSTLNIKSVKILDVLGRTLYQLKGSSTTEIYNLSNLSQSAYIAKVELSNGQIITKRAIKRK